MLEIHLDLVGGLAGDMFIAALLDAWPAHEERVRHAIDVTGAPRVISCSLRAHRDHVLTGSRFEIIAKPSASTRPAFAATPHEHLSPHEHVSWSSIRARLNQAPLPDRVRHHATAIFELLAEAEARVHGVAVDSVEFHEVGAWDSIADIVGAATLIDALGATHWTHSAIPLGSGRVATAHGVLPVPTPATVRLLLGMPILDDGVPGERVTPTGAAILRYLAPPSAAVSACQSNPRTLIANGTGFGSRTLRGLSNHLRALCFDRVEHHAGQNRRLHVIEFEVDDQSGEDLATGLDRIRLQNAVLDVTQAAVFGKKGRVTTQVRVLARADALQQAVNACFAETTTIGLRHHCVEGIGLVRRMEQATIDGRTLRVKVVARPGRLTAKTESDDVLNQTGHHCRASLRQRAEAAVLSGLAQGATYAESAVYSDSPENVDA